MDNATYAANLPVVKVVDFTVRKMFEVEILGCLEVTGNVGTPE